jgi:cell division protein FtsL
MTGWGRARLALIALAVAAIMFVFVFPTRSYLAQRHQVAASAHDVAVLKKQNNDLAAEAQRLRSRAEIERRARQQFGLAYPGEQVYKVMPAPEAATTTTLP